MPRERLACGEAGADRNERPGGTLGEPEPSPLPRLEHRDREIGIGRGERAHVTDQIGITEEKRPWFELAFGERQCLTLPAPFERDHAGARRARHLGCPVARAVVGDDQARPRKPGAERFDRRPDPLLLVPRCDKDREARIAHPCDGRGVIGGRIPSTAVASRP